jgi:hypothetical protein
MLVMSKGALSAGQAATYYEEKYSRDDLWLLKTPKAPKSLEFCDGRP